MFKYNFIGSETAQSGGSAGGGGISGDIKLSAIDIDADKDWNNKEITNIRRIAKQGSNKEGFELLENELRLCDNSGNCVVISKNDADDKTEIYTENEQGNKLPGVVVFGRDRVTIDSKNMLLVRGRSIYKTTTTKLLRKHLDIFRDKNFYINIASNYVYIGGLDAWGEVAKLPYRFALPIGDDDELKGTYAIKTFKFGFITEEVEVDTILDNGNGGKKKYKTIRFRPTATDLCEVRLDMSFMLKSIDEDDWIAIGIDDKEPNGEGGHKYTIGGLSIKKDKFTQGNSVTVQISGSYSVTLDKNKWYYISVQSINKGYIQNATLSIRKNYNGNEG